MALSVFDLFSIGVGPSSSHTVGPMRAARMFVDSLKGQGLVLQAQRVKVELFGSLAFTGKGHWSDRAILLGLEGERPREVAPDKLTVRVQEILDRDELMLAGEKPIPFVYDRDMVFEFGELLPHYSNGMRFTLYGAEDSLLLQEIYYSIGGGFVVGEDGQPLANRAEPDVDVPYPFTTAETLRELCAKHGLSIAQLMLENECAMRSANKVNWELQEIWQVMRGSIERGLNASGELPGNLHVKRRSPELFRRLEKKVADNPKSVDSMDRLSVYAIAVNEENAAGGRVVTAPTNGAAGIIPSVLYFYLKHTDNPSEDKINDFLMTAAAIGMLYKHGASISAAEVGCQGEVGVACSMAAAGYAAIHGGTVAQVENAAEMGMEHNLGLTCDPIGGLVQIPCIERNAMGAVKAVNCARLALNEDGTNKVSLDEVIATMMQTGRDMMSKYKETSEGGLAVNVPEC